MDINKLLKADYLDILFEGRNKKYGGYELRRKYPRRMRNAALATIAVVVLAVGIPAIAGMVSKDEEVMDMRDLKEVTLAEPPPIDPKKPPPPPPPPAPPPPVKPTVAFTPPVIKKDEEVREEEKPPPVEEAEKKAVGLENKEGDPNGIEPAIVDVSGQGQVEAPAPPPPKVFQFVEQMPEFPGGNEKVNAYLAANLRYPDAAREAGIEGRVVLRFVVNEDGGISEVTVMRGIGGGCDEEAIRVVKGMPKWKAGRQNGNPVKVYFTLPITFRLQ